MADGDLISEDWQVEFHELLLGGDSSAFSFVSAEGLADLPDLVTADRAKLRRHGTTPGDDFMVDRIVTMVFEVYGDTIEEFESAIAELAEATRPGVAESPLSFRIPGVAGSGVRRVGARVRKRSVPVNQEWYHRIPLVTLQFCATDPRIYSAELDSQTVNLPSGTAGLAWPATWPAVWTVSTDSGSLYVENVGNFSSPWTATITGPCVNPSIRNVTDGTSLTFNITLVDGDELTLDSSTRRVVLNGTESRYYTIAVGSQWFDFEPGTTEVAFRASTTTDATLTLNTRSAWTS